MVRYVRPRTIAEVLIVRERHDVQILAGGTDIYPAKANRAGWGHTHHADILDISGIDELRGIALQGADWRIGGLTTWSQIAQAQLPPAFDGLKEAARQIGGKQIQNRGTIAGNLCNASPAADGVPPLLALNAQVELTSRSGSRLIPLESFIVGYRKTVLRNEEIMTAVLVPDQEGMGAFLKLGARKHLVISIAMAGAVVDIDRSGKVRSARISVGACSAIARRLHNLERDLMGRAIEEAEACVEAAHLAELSPIDDVRASAAYRRRAAHVLVQDLLRGYANWARRAA